MLGEKFKDTVRRSPFLYELIRQQRAEKKEKEYLHLCQHYANLTRSLSVCEGYLDLSATLLNQGSLKPNQAKKTLSDIRLFVIDRPCLGGPWFLAEWANACETIAFNLNRYIRKRPGQETDKLRAASSFDVSDRTKPYLSNVDYRDWRPTLQRDLLKAVNEAHQERPIDLIFAYASYFEIEPETFRAMRAMGIPVALFWLDDKHTFLENTRFNFPNGQKPLIGSCDVHLTNSIECVWWYLGEGAPAFYFPQGVDVELFSPIDGPKDIPVSFIGAAYGMRGMFVRRLKQHGIPVQCFGRGWDNGVVSDDIDIYRRSRVNLGIGGVSYSEKMSCIKGRDLEVPATGSLYLTTYDAELGRLFDIGHEIICYRNEIDCVELIRHYLDNPDEAEVIGRAGRARCIRDHTWTGRLEGLLRWMGILDESEVSG